MVIPTHSVARAVGTADQSFRAGLRLSLRKGTAPSQVTSGGAAVHLGAGALHSPKIPPWSQDFTVMAALPFLPPLRHSGSRDRADLTLGMMLHMRRTSAASIHYCRLGSGLPCCSRDDGDAPMVHRRVCVTQSSGGWVHIKTHL